VAQLEYAVDDATYLPSDPSEALSRPQAAHGLVRILPDPDAPSDWYAMSDQGSSYMRWESQSGFQTAVQRGLILVAFEYSLHARPDALERARKYVHEHRLTPFDLGVFAFLPHDQVPPELVMELSREQVVVARGAGETSVDKALAFVDEFRRRETAEQQNFREFASQADALRERVEASRRRR